MSITSTFAAGEIYSKTGAIDKVGRIYGSGIGTAKVTASRCFAYEGQNINGKQNTDRLDAYAADVCRYHGPVLMQRLAGAGELDLEADSGCLAVIHRNQYMVFCHI